MCGIYTNGFTVFLSYLDSSIDGIILETQHSSIFLSKDSAINWLIHNNMELVGYCGVFL